MAFKSKAFDLAIGMLSQSIMAGSGILMLPFVVTRLSPEQVGLWYIYLNIQAIVFLLDFGITDTFTRFFSYVFAGATKITEQRIPPRQINGEINYLLLAALLSSSRRLYLAIALIGGVAMSTAGTYYIYIMTYQNIFPESIWPSWFIFTSAMLCQTYFQWQGPLLIGSDRTRRNYEIAVRSRLVQVIVTIFSLVLYPSLTVMSLAFFISAIYMRFEYIIAIRNIHIERFSQELIDKNHGDLTGILIRSARLLGGSVLGVLLTNRLVALAIGWFAGLTVSAQYSIANQALVALTSVAFVFQTMISPKIASAGLGGNMDAQRFLFSLSLAFGFLVYMVGGTILITAIPYLLNAIGSGTTLPPILTLILMISIYYLEMNMFTATRMITSVKNTIPYWRSMILTGLAVIVAVLSAGFVGLGLVGMLVAQLAPQIAYNYWRWPSYCFSILEMSYKDIPYYVKNQIGAVIRRKK